TFDSSQLRRRDPSGSNECAIREGTVIPSPDGRLAMDLTGQGEDCASSIGVYDARTGEYPFAWLYGYGNYPSGTWLDSRRCVIEGNGLDMSVDRPDLEFPVPELVIVNFDTQTAKVFAGPLKSPTIVR